MKCSHLLILAILITLIACAPATPHTLTVFAAASLTNAFDEIGQDFEASHPGVAVIFNFGNSQILRTQIEQGAIADVFASANQMEMDALTDSGLVTEDAARVFVTNQLIVILPANNPANVQGMADLAHAGTKIVLAAEEAPAGKYARQALENLNALYGVDFKDRVLANVVSNEENVRLVVAKVQLGEADAGIVYISDAIAAPELKTIQIAAEHNVIAKYYIAMLNNAPNSEPAAEFVAYILSPGGQAILNKWGFIPITP